MNTNQVQFAEESIILVFVRDAIFFIILNKSG